MLFSEFHDFLAHLAMASWSYIRSQFENIAISPEFLGDFIVHIVQQVGVYIGCAPDGTTCQISQLPLSFQVTLCAKCYFS